MIPTRSSRVTSDFASRVILDSESSGTQEHILLFHESGRLQEELVTYFQVKVKVMLRPTVSQPIRLGVRHPSGTHDQFFFPLEILFRQLRVCYFVTPSLTRGRVCNLLLVMVLASAVPLGSESHGTQDHILLSQFLRLPQPGGPSPRIYIPQEQGGPDIPQALGSLSVASYDSQSYGGGIRSRLHTGRHLLSFHNIQSIWCAKYQIENAASNSSVVVWVFVAAGTCLPIGLPRNDRLTHRHRGMKIIS
jgi:hypothetical protein